MYVGTDTNWMVLVMLTNRFTVCSLRWTVYWSLKIMTVWHPVATLGFYWDVKTDAAASRWKYAVCYIWFKGNTLLSEPSSQIVVRK